MSEKRYATDVDSSYGVWDDIHARKAPEDQERMEWLNRMCRRPQAPPKRRAYGPRYTPPGLR